MTPKPDTWSDDVNVFCMVERVGRVAPEAVVLDSDVVWGSSVKSGFDDRPEDTPPVPKYACVTSPVEEAEVITGAGGFESESVINSEAD